MVGKAVFVFLRLFLVLVHMLAVESFDHADVDGNASSVAMPGPLRILWFVSGCLPDFSCPRACAYQLPGSFICLDVEIVVELLYHLLLEPFLCVGELADCALNVKLAGS